MQFNRVDLGVHLVSTTMVRSVATSAGHGVVSNGSQPGVGGSVLAPMPLSNMIGAFMQQYVQKTNTPSPDKMPLYANYGMHFPGQSPVQLSKGVNTRIKEEPPKIEFDREKLDAMDPCQRRRYLLEALNEALQQACGQERTLAIRQGVDRMYSECLKEIESLREGKCVLHEAAEEGDTLTASGTGSGGGKSLQAEVAAHIKSLMAILFMLERVPSMFETFVHGLELL